jgi:hypothetical protein
MSTSFTNSKKQEVKNLTSVFIITTLMILLNLGVNAQAVYTQDFNFSGTLTSNSWTAHSGVGTNAISTTTGLTYGAHSGSGVGNAALIGNLGGEDINQSFTSQSTNGSSVYASFLCNITDVATAKTGDYFFHLGSPGGTSWTAYSSRVFARIVSGNVNFGISNTSTATYGTTNFSKNTTYLIVIKYTITTGTTADAVSMWVIPSGMPASEGLAGIPEVTNTITNGTDAISAIGLRQGSSATSPQTVVDAIRVGADWASVVPVAANAPSTQASAVTFSGSTSNSTTVSWTNGNGNGRIVKMNTSSSFTAPSNGTTYSGNAVYAGSGEQVVYAGTGNSVSVSGLTPGQAYHFRVYEYNSTGMLYNSFSETNNPNSTTLNYPVPVANSLSPNSASAGSSSFTLTVSGFDFYPASVVNWNGSPLATIYVNGTTLTASVPATDIDTSGIAAVTVTNPAPGGGPSTVLSFAINANTLPLISVNAFLSVFTTEAGTPSATQSYTVSGSNLTNDITVTPSSGFEIRTGSNPFSNAPVVLSAGTGSSSVTEFTVTVDLKDASHPNFGTGYPSGYLLNGDQGPVLTLVRGTTYKFYFDGQATCCSSTLGHPFIFTSSEVGGGANSGDVINTGVMQYGDSTFFTPDATTPSLLYYMCDVHQSMGSSINVIDPVIGSVAPTTIDIRFNPTNVGAFVGSVVHSSTGASDQVINLNGSAINSTPTVQSAITLTSASANTLSFSLNGGDGSGRILVASTSPVTFVPTDAVAATGVNANWTLATDQGSSNKIVYDGSGTSVTVSGLTANTTYYFAVYDYNGSASTVNYLQTAPGTTSAGTLVAEPTTSSLVSITRITSDTAYVNFTGGSGANRIVVVNTTGAVSFTPVDATTYSGASLDLNTAFDLGGGNKLVYQGNATSAKITGFPAGSNFNVTVFEYNGSGSTLNYRNTGASASAVSPSYISYTSGAYFQDFNTLPSTGIFATSGFGQGPYYLTSAPINASGTTGWQIAAITGVDVKLSTDAGAGNGGSNYNYGSTSATDRAIGCLASSSYLGSVGAVLVNNSTGPLNKVTITYVGENWRRGGSGSFNKMLFSYKVGENSIKGAGFTVVPSLDFSTPTPVSGTAVALDGNAAANRTVITATFNLDNNWMPGQTLTIRWNDVDETGTDDGLAIDSLTFVAEGPSTPLAQDSLITFSNTLTTSTDVNWTNGDATSRIVVMNTSNSFTNPVDGNTYTANNVYSGVGEQIIYNGSGSTVNVSGLTASTSYYFRVYGYNGAGAATKYSIATATQNPNSQITSAPQAPTKIVVTNLNNGNPILENTPFSITIQAQDNNNSPQNVSTATTIDLTLFSGIGVLGGTTSGTIAVGTNQVTITGVLYDVPDYGAQILADATAGELLGSAYSNYFDVYGVATSLAISNLTPGVPINTVIPNFDVTAYRADYTTDIYYNGTATITVSSGPSGSITGTLTANFVNGVATFSGIQFSAPGTYILQANAGSLPAAFSSNLIITPTPTMTELVIPKYMGSKTGSAVNNARTPVAFCIQLDNLLPNTIYNLAAGLAATTDLATSMGAGGVWNGSAYGLNISNAFTTNASGSSGPVWIYMQPSGNSSRFGAGQVHNLRIAYSNTAFGAITSPNFSSTNTITSLDIATAALSANTADDGAFVTGNLNSCMGGKLVLVYDNTAGTGNPLYAFQAVTSTATQITNSEFPTSVDSIYRNISNPGTFAAVIPVAALSTNGVKRIETRDLQNNLINSITDADGIWSSGANTTNLVRRGLVSLTNADADLTTMNTISVTGTNANCFGSSDGYATALATSSNSTINYLWSAGSTTDTQSALAAGTYTVTVTDGNGCSLTSGVTISQPSSNNPTASNNGPICIGSDITLTASSGVSYAWSGPYSYSSTDQIATAPTTSYLLSEAGAQVYSVVITYANGCTETASTTVVLNDCSCTPPTLSASTTNVLCKNDATGSINLTITGGVAPYSIVWSNGATTEDVSALVAGTYKVVVTENGGCKDSLTITITEPSGILSSTTTSTNATCFGYSNGAIDLTVSGGTSPYSFVWSNTATSEDLSNLVIGTYDVTVTDANGCTASNSVTITEPSEITITANAVNNALCYGLNGSIDISSSADIAGNATGDPGLLISELMPDPTGTDNSNEWVELIATRSIDFSVTPFSVVFANNGTATVNGWKAGAGITYGFNINSGSVQKGDVVYVGGSLMTPTGTKLRVISTGTVAGDAFGNLASGGVLGNGTTSADAVAVFNVDAASITNTTVPVDAIFYGTALGNAIVSSGTAGYTLPVNDKYNGGYLQSTSYFIPSNPTQGKAFYATGVFNYQSGQFTTPRTWATDATSFTNSTSSVGVVNSTTYLWSNGATTQDVNVPAGTYTVTVTNATGCTQTATYTITQPAQPAMPTLACYETASFNTSTCAWDVTGTQPSVPTLACYQTATFNTTTCQWDVTGSPAATIETTETSCGSYTWSANGQVYTQSGTYSYNSNCQDYQLNLTIVNVSVSGVSPTSGTIGSAVVISGSGFTGVTSVQFNGVNATTYTIDNDGQITATIPTGSTTGAITVVKGSCSAASASSFTVLTNATLNLKAYMQGFYAGSGLMNSVLANQGLSLNTNEVDTITVELYDGSTGATLVASTSGVILTDGTISLSLSGSVIGNSYYVSLRHRNTINTWSASAITFGTTTTYDFTTAATQAYGGNMIEVETGVFAMYSGDFNQDEFVDPYDYPSFELDNVTFALGYLSTDINGDGYVDPYDYPVFEFNNVNFVMSMHP